MEKPKRCAVALLSLLSQTGLAAISANYATGTPAVAQEVYQTLNFGTTGTFLTGIRGDNIVGNYVIPGTSATGGLLYRSSTITWTPFPVATASGTNFPGSTSSSPYGPSFGSEGGILRVVGSYKTSISPYDLGYLYDAATSPQARLTTLTYPGTAGAPTLNTIAHSTFGNQVVGNYDTQLQTGNAFVYDIKTGTYRTNDAPGAVSTTAYGVWATKIAGGYAQLGPGGGPGFERGYIFDQATGVWTSYNHPGALVTHFEGITGAGRAGEYNLVADWLDPAGNLRASVLHLDAAGHENWIDIAVPGASLTSANSVYQGTVIGVYTGTDGVTNGYVVNVPGIYDPIRNSGASTIGANDTPAIAAGDGDDVVNDGAILTTGIRSPGIRGGAYGVITNNGVIAVTGADSAAIELNGPFGTLFNTGSISAALGGDAIRTGPSASGTVIVNDGTIDGHVSVLAGVDARFENSGWLGISAPGAGTTHTITGSFAQTAAGTLVLRLSSDGNHDALQIAGTARLAGTLALVPQPGLYAAQTVYRDLVYATDALFGGFANVSTDSPFLQASLTAANNRFSAVLTRTPFDVVAGLTANQRAIGRGLERGYGASLGSDVGTGFYSTLLTSRIAPGAVGAAYDAIGGEGVTGSQQTAFAAASRFVEAIREQGAFWLSTEAQGVSGQGPVGPPGTASTPFGAGRVWASASGAGTHLDSGPALGAASLSIRSWGGAAGLEFPLSPDLLVGVAGGGSGSNFSVSQRGTNGTVDGGQFGIYAIGRWKGLYTSGAFAWGHYGIGTTRSGAPFGVADTKSGSFDASVLTGRLEAGCITETALANITPFVAVEPSRINQPSFVETPRPSGSPLLVLAFSDKTVTSVPTSLGIQLDRAALLDNGWTLAPYLRAAWLHEWNTARSISASLPAAPGTLLNIQGTPAARNAARLVGTLELAQAASVAFYANIVADLSSRGQSVGGNFGFKVTW